MWCTCLFTFASNGSQYVVFFANYLLVLWRVIQVMKSQMRPTLIHCRNQKTRPSELLISVTFSVFESVVPSMSSLTFYIVKPSYWLWSHYMYCTFVCTVGQLPSILPCTVHAQCSSETYANIKTRSKLIQLTFFPVQHHDPQRVLWSSCFVKNRKQQNKENQDKSKYIQETHHGDHISDHVSERVGTSIQAHFKRVWNAFDHDVDMSLSCTVAIIQNPPTLSHLYM